MYRSQKNIQNQRLDYRSLYLKQKKLKEQYQRRAQVAELKYRKLAQSVNKKCIRCINVDHGKNKQNQILLFKQFVHQLQLRHNQTATHGKQKLIFQKQKIINNFAVFGLPQSLLIQPQHTQPPIQGQLIYTSDIPTIVQQHASKLAFPSGIIPKYYQGTDAKQKAEKIINQGYEIQKYFIMSFQSNKKDQIIYCPVRNIMNIQNKLFANCFVVQEFSLVPNWNVGMIQSDKIMIENKQLLQTKILSYEQTDISLHHEIQCSIVVTPRIYCIFSQYPFFTFYREVIREIVNIVKGQRMVRYRESGCTLAEVDSHYFLERVKEIYRGIAKQIQEWELKINRQHKLQMQNKRIIQLSLNIEQCSLNYVKDWGMPIINIFKFDPFLDVFTLIMLQEKVVFVSQNQTITSMAVHLFTQILPRPFVYPFPVINVLPQNQGYFATPCPFVYGSIYTKKGIKKISENNSNIIFVMLQKQGVQILCVDYKKHVIKKRSKYLREILSRKFKGNSIKKDKNMLWTNQQINYNKDKDGICLEIIKSINNYLKQQVLSKLPEISEVNSILQNLTKNKLKNGQDLHQVAFKKIKKQCLAKSNDQFFHALLDTQIINTYLFK